MNKRNKNSNKSSLGGLAVRINDGVRCKRVLTLQDLHIHSYLLVISVWERQDGENTALKYMQTESIRLSS